MGLGGHVEPGETDAQAACREVQEEAGVVVLERTFATPDWWNSSFRPGRNGT